MQNPRRTHVSHVQMFSQYPMNGTVWQIHSDCESSDRCLSIFADDYTNHVHIFFRSGCVRPYTVRNQFSRFSAHSETRVMPTKNCASIKTICLINTLHFVYRLHWCQAMPYTIAEHVTLFDFDTHPTTRKTWRGKTNTHLKTRSYSWTTDLIAMILCRCQIKMLYFMPTYLISQ